MLKAAISTKALAVAFALLGFQFVCFCCSWPILSLGVPPVDTTGRTANDYSPGERAAFSEYKGTLWEAPEDNYFGIVWKLDCAPGAVQADEGARQIGEWLCGSPLAAIFGVGGRLGLLPLLLLAGIGVAAVVLAVRGASTLVGAILGGLARGLSGLTKGLLRLMRRLFLRGPAWKTIPGVAPSAANPGLRSIFKELFRPTDKIPGGTAGAIRHEIQTGQLAGNKSHIIKGLERARQLAKIIQKGNLSENDAATARAVLDDLLDALKSGGYTI